MAELKDLYEHVTPRYAVHWKVIGTLLGLPTETLDIIEYDNCNRGGVVACCNAMLVKWLEVDKDASWKKMFKAIQSPAVSTGIH